MIAVTIGIGNRWGEAAARAANRVHQMTGLETAVIDHPHFNVAHVSWLKLKILEIYPQHEEFLYFDSDILMMREWDVSGMFTAMGRSFMAVPDVRSEAVLSECHEYRIPFPDWYVNAGLFVFGREHAPIIDSAFSRHPKYGSWLEQTSLNRSLLNGGMEICRLPRTFNTLLWPGIDSYESADLRSRKEVCLHAASLGGDCGRLLIIQDSAGLA